MYCNNDAEIMDSMQLLDWTSGLDWWTRLVDQTGGLETCGKVYSRFVLRINYTAVQYY